MWNSFFGTGKKLLITLILFVCLFISFAFVPRLLNAGLNSPQAISKFLNGSLPSITPDQGGGGTGVQIVEAFPNLTADSTLVFVPEPGTNRIVIGSRNGLYEAFPNTPSVTNAQKKVFLDIRNSTVAAWDAGNLSLTFHPQFLSDPNKRYVYVWHSARHMGSGIAATPAHKWYIISDPVFMRLSRFSVYQDGAGDWVADRNSEYIMMNIHMHGTTHYGGSLVWDDQENLIISYGEMTVANRSQDPREDLTGGFLRIDVDQRGGAISHLPKRIAQNDPTYGAIQINGFGSRADPASTADMGNPGFLQNPAREFTGRGYYIPNDNPNWATLAAQKGISLNAGDYFEEYITIGNRNPYRLTKDRLTGRFWSGEIGDASREEINVLESDELSTGLNYGWPGKEGNLNRSSTAAYWGSLKAPITDFQRSEANAIMGGYVYRGTQLGDLYGKYIAGDHAQQKIYAISYNTDANGHASFVSKVQVANFTPGSLVTFGEDHQGELYLCRQGNDTKIYKLAPINPGAPAPQSPARLSDIDAFETNAQGNFSGIGTLAPKSGVLPYEINVPFWSDGAKKYRYVAIPNNDDGNGIHNSNAEKMVFSEEGNWQFPQGAVFIKHFELPVDENNPSLTKKVETRFTVHGDDGEYYFITYKWLDDQSDAVLLLSGEDKDFTIQTPTGNRTQVWHFPNRQECTQCHNSATSKALGFNTRQLNRNTDYTSIGGSVGNQLETFLTLNMFHGAPFTPGDIANFLTLSPTAGSDPLEDRARSYLDANCSHCHQPGTGNRAVFDARYSTPFANQNMINAPLNNNLGNPNASVIVPQDVPNSMLHTLTASNDPNIRMPRIGRNEIDQAGVTLIADWINGIQVNNPPQPPFTPSCASDASESFSYFPGSVLSGSNGGNGFGGAWITEQQVIGNQILVSSGSLQASGMQSFGNKIRVDLDANGGGIRMRRDFAQNVAATDTLWVQMIFRANTLSNGGLWLRPNGRQDIAIGKRFFSVFGIDNNSGTGTIQSGQNYRLLARYVFDTGSTNVQLWLDPTEANFDINTPWASKNVGASIASIDHFTLAAETYNTGDYEIDEISFSCALPEDLRPPEPLCTSEASEPFAYSVGASLSGSNGGTGFNGAWTTEQQGSGNQMLISATSLTANGMQSQGNKIHVDLAAAGGGIRLRRSFAQNVASTGTVWVQMLFKANTLSSGGLWLRPNGRQDIAIGKRWGSVFGIDNNSGSGVIQVGETYRLLARYVFSPGNTQVQLWLNPSAATFDLNTPWATKTVATTISSIDHLTLSVETYNTGDYEIDEISFSCQTPPDLQLSTEFQAKMFLEGPYDANTGLMSDYYRSNNLLSLQDPFGLQTSLSSGLLTTTGSDAVVDWIKVELRNASNPQILVAKKAVLLQKDGNLMDQNGNLGLSFPGIAPGDYYVMLQHPSHLAVMTAQAENLSTNPVLNFSSPLFQTYSNGAAAMKTTNGVQMLWAGDANGDGSINAIDQNLHWLLQNGAPFIYGTTKADFNLDGVVNALDLNIFWRVNNSRVSQVP